MMLGVQVEWSMSMSRMAFAEGERAVACRQYSGWTEIAAAYAQL